MNGCIKIDLKKLPKFVNWQASSPLTPCPTSQKRSKTFTQQNVNKKSNFHEILVKADRKGGYYFSPLCQDHTNGFS